MKRKLLGLLGILALISGCSNVNQRSIDPVASNESAAKKINLIKKANSIDENTKVYTTSEGIAYALTWDENKKDYYIYFLEKEVDGITYVPYKYVLDENLKVVINSDNLLSSNSSTKRSFREILTDLPSVIYVSKAEYNPNKLVYVKESTSYDTVIPKTYRHFRYGLSEYSDFDVTNGYFLNLYPYNIFNDCKIEYSPGESLEESKEKANSYLNSIFPENLYDKLYVKDFRLENFPSDVLNNPEAPKYIFKECEKTFVEGEESGVEILPYEKSCLKLNADGYVLISKNFNCRDLLTRICSFYKDGSFVFSFPSLGLGSFNGGLSRPDNGEIGSINQIYIKRGTSTNEYMPYDMFINFDVVDRSTFEFVGTAQVIISNVIFLEDIKYKFDNKVLKKDDHINIGYGRKLKDLFDIFSFSFLKDYFSLIIDGKEYTTSSEELEKSFYELNLKSTSLLEICLNPGGYHKGIFCFNNVTRGTIEEGTPYTSNVMELYLDFNDDINPVLNSEIKSYRTSKEENFKYKELFKAVDEKDNDVSDTIELVKEENKIFVTAKDKSGNVGKREITLDVDPVLYENINVINDSIFEIPENVFITKNRVEKILAKIHSKEVKDLDMITYINNSKVKGEYKVTYKVDEENKELTFKVIDPIEEKVTPESFSDQANEFKDSFIGKVKTFFIKLGNWFRGVFTKWRFDCYLTNEEWDTRFN